MSTIRANTLVDMDGVSAVTLARQVAAKAWINFNGTSTIATRASFNVASITDNGTGDYGVTFTTAMIDNSYSITTSANHGRTDVREPCYCGHLWTGDITSSAIRIATGQGGFGYADSSIVSVAIHR